MRNRIIVPDRKIIVPPWVSGPALRYARPLIREIQRILSTPIVESVTITPFGTDANSHLVAMPATVNAGDLLIILFSHDDNTGLTQPTGWSTLWDTAGPSSQDFAAFAKDAVGTEGGTTVDCVTSTTQKAVTHVWRISNWGGTLATDVDVGTPATGTSTEPDPPSVTAGWGSDTNLWIACFGGNNNGSVSAYPTGYADNQNATVSGASGGDATIASCSKAATAASDDPAVFTWSLTTGWVAQTIVIKPAADILMPQAMM